MPNHRVSWHAHTYTQIHTYTNAAPANVKAPLDARETEIYQQAVVEGEERVDTV